MGEPDAQPAFEGSGASAGVRLPVLRIVLFMLAAAMTAGGVAGVLLLAAGRIDGLSFAAALASVTVGICLMVVPIVALSGRPAVTVASGVVFGGFAGGLLAAGLAVAAFLALGLSGPGFWFVFLAASLSAMASKLGVVLPAIREADVAATSEGERPTPAAPGTEAFQR